jgi:F-type H+-transporting ATPase subunit alpha
VLEVLEGGVINEQVTKVIEDVAQSTLLLFKH